MVRSLLWFAVATGLEVCTMVAKADQWPRFDFREGDRHPASQVAFEGYEVRLIAQSSSEAFDETTYQWFKDGERLGGTNVSTLVFTNLSRTDGGVYHAVARNRFGEAISRRARVEVICRPPLPGHLDPNFVGVATKRNEDEVRAIAIDDLGRVIIAGEFNRYGTSTAKNIVRLESDGSIDTEFNVGTGANAEIRAVAVDGDSIWIGGFFTEFNGTECKRVVRLNEDGSIASGFQTITGPESDVRTILPDGDGAVVIGGTFKTVGSIATGNLARIFDDGQVDLDFAPGIKGNVEDSARDSQNRIVLVGDFVNGSYKRIARLRPSGDFDPSFLAAGASRTIRAVAIQSDGSIVVGGDFTSILGGAPQRGVARLLSNGEFDPSFNINLDSPVANRRRRIEVTDIAVDLKDRILVSGKRFDTINGKSCPKLARILASGNLDEEFVADRVDGDVLVLAISSNGSVLVGGDFEFPHRSIMQLASDPPAPTENPILCQPRDWSTNIGTVARFSVVATASKPITYQWYHNGAMIPGAEAREATYEIFRVSEAHRGRYHCRLDIGGASIESEAAMLKVTPVPPGSARCYHYRGDRDVKGVDYAVLRDNPDALAPVLSTFLRVDEAVPIGDVDVTFTLEHEHTNQLTVQLVFEPSSGGGDFVVPLFSPVSNDEPGGFGFVRTTIDDEVSRSIGDALPLFVGSFRSERRRMGDFDGQLARGAWRLQVFDEAEDQVAATLKSWELIITERLEIPAYDTWAADYFESASPPPSHVDTDGDGVENVVDYVMGRQSGEPLPISVEFENSKSVLRYRRRSELVGDFKLVYEGSENLTDWTQLEPYVVVLPGLFEQAQFQLRSPPVQYFRLRIE